MDLLDIGYKGQDNNLLKIIKALGTSKKNRNGILPFRHKLVTLYVSSFLRWLINFAELWCDCVSRPWIRAQTICDILWSELWMICVWVWVSACDVTAPVGEPTIRHGGCEGHIYFNRKRCLQMISKYICWIKMTSLKRKLCWSLFLTVFTQ